MMEVYRYQTPEGFDNMLMSTDGEVLSGLWFEGSRDADKHISNLVETCRGASLPPIIRDTCQWLDIYFSGCQPDFTPAYRMQDLTPFRKT